MTQERTDWILFQDPAKENRVEISRLLRARGFPVEETSSMGETLERLDGRSFAVLIIRCMMEGAEETRFLTLIRHANPEMELLVFVPPQGIHAGRKLMRWDAFDYMVYPSHADPAQMEELMARVEKAVQSARLRIQIRDLRVDFVRKVYLEREKLLFRHMASTRVLVDLFESKLPFYTGHSRRVAEYAGWIAEDIGMPRQMASDLATAGCIHDIGYLGIPDSTLSKLGPLSDQERSEVRSHPVMSQNILEGILPSRALGFIRHHHERWDGHGYPDGLAAGSIPLGARVIALADAFDAMVSERAYRKPLRLESALREIDDRKGEQFDPALTQVFVSGIARRKGLVEAGNGGYRLT